MNLESPEADQVLNAGTAAPNCQPKQKEQREDEEDPNADKRLSEKHRRNSSSDADHRTKRQHTEQQQQAMTAQQQKKLSYIQMAKLGYQELVNAIIRPPRADYKVCVLAAFSMVLDDHLEWMTKLPLALLNCKELRQTI